MNKSALTLYVVDDDEALRRSMMMLLFSQNLAVQCFDSGEAFLSAIEGMEFGVVILDLRMKRMSGLEVFKQLTSKKSALVTLFMSGHGDIPSALDAIHNGAFDWIVKPDTEQLLNKLPLAMQEARERQAAYGLWQELTPRECEVANLVGLGQPNKEIARILNPSCSPRSVETHRANIFSKLHISNDNELGRWLSRHQWLTSHSS
jgi:two-component system, LuxR family, response regulator TtrR